MSEHAVLDARRLGHDEPLVPVLDAIRGFRKGDTLKVLMDREPRTLYPILERAGFGHHAEPGIDSAFEVTIWPVDA